jgi:hypothetical protein
MAEGRSQQSALLFLISHGSLGASWQAPGMTFDTCCEGNTHMQGKVSQDTGLAEPQTDDRSH